MRKYYRLTKDLPTFKKDQIFYINDHGSLVSTKDNVVAYVGATIAVFPNILKDWFVEIPEPERDKNTKHEFIDYLNCHKDERFFQAVRNFTNLYLDGKVDRICCHRSRGDDGWFEDTFYWECDEMLKEEEE